MKIAVTYEDGEIFGHFGHTEQFKIYEIENKEIVNTSIIDTQGSGHGLLGSLLIQNGVNILICGGIGSGAKNILSENNIEIYPGVTGSADEAVESFINGTLEYNIDTQCDHHNHEHEHDCSTHDCASNKGGCAGNK